MTVNYEVVHLKPPCVKIGIGNVYTGASRVQVDVWGTPVRRRMWTHRGPWAFPVPDIPLEVFTQNWIFNRWLNTFFFTCVTLITDRVPVSTSIDYVSQVVSDPWVLLKDLTPFLPSWSLIWRTGNRLRNKRSVRRPLLQSLSTNQFPHTHLQTHTRKLTVHSHTYVQTYNNTLTRRRTRVYLFTPSLIHAHTYSDLLIHTYT